MIAISSVDPNINTFKCLFQMAISYKHYHAHGDLLTVLLSSLDKVTYDILLATSLELSIFS